MCLGYTLEASSSISLLCDHYQRIEFNALRIEVFTEATSLFSASVAMQVVVKLLIVYAVSASATSYIHKRASVSERHK